jgi:hypothetical protein
MAIPDEASNSHAGESQQAAIELGSFCRSHAASVDSGAAFLLCRNSSVNILKAIQGSSRQRNYEKGDRAISYCTPIGLDVCTGNHFL